MWPESGLSSPRHSLRIVLFPDPAIPNTTLVSPRLSSNDTPSSTMSSSKRRETSSKMIALWTVSVDGLSNGGMESTQHDEELRKNSVNRQDKHRRRNDGLRG